jgi:hypothetical protein
VVFTAGPLPPSVIEKLMRICRSFSSDGSVKPTLARLRPCSTPTDPADPRLRPVTTTGRSLRHRAGDARVTAGVRANSVISRLRGQRVVHMLHIRKTGGTAVKAALGGIRSPQDLRLLLHPHRVSLSDVPASDEVFFFLRDPVSRFISGFESRRREGRPAHYHPWSPAERHAYERFDTPEALGMALAANDAELRRAAEQAMTSINHVRSRLSDWLVSERLVRSRSERILLVGWQETLDYDFERLVELLDLPSAITLPTDEAAAHRSSTDGRHEALSVQAAATIRDWYAQDYRLIDLIVELGLTERPISGGR